RRIMRVKPAHRDHFLGRRIGNGHVDVVREVPQLDNARDCHVADPPASHMLPRHGLRPPSPQVLLRRQEPRAPPPLLAALDSRLRRSTGRAARTPHPLRPTLSGGSCAGGRSGLPSTLSAARSPTITAAALLLPPINSGKTEASATRSPSMPMTLRSGSTTLAGSPTRPMRAVPQGWCTV